MPSFTRGRTKQTIIHLTTRTAGLSPKENEQRVEKGLKVIVGVDRRAVIHGDLAEHLHANHGIDEEEHGNEQSNVGQCLNQILSRSVQRDNPTYLKGLDECPE